MPPMIPPEMIDTAAQMVICFFTVVVALLSFVMMGRA